MVLTACFLSIDDVELSGEATSVAINTASNAVDVTTFDSEGWQDNEGGIKSWSLAAEAIMDEATVGELFAKNGDSAGVAVEVRATQEVTSPTNPSYQGTGLITEFNPISGAPGDAHKVSISIVGKGALTRSTTAV